MAGSRTREGAAPTPPPRQLAVLSSSASSLLSPPPRRPGRPTVYSPSEKKRRRKSLERRRTQSRICVKEQTERWMSVRETLNVFSHAEVAKFLLDLYDKYGGDVCKESQVKQDTDGSSVLKAEEDVSETPSAATAERCCRIYHRESGRWTLVPKKEEMHYVCIDDIMEEIFQHCLET